MRLLLLDNHDSFTAILHHILWELAGERPLLIRNDALTRDELGALAFDAAVLSPGPGHPANVRDFGVCRDLLELFPHMPVLGVCLGMQGLAHFAGARVAPLPGARHGRPSRLRHDGSDAGLYRGIPQDGTVIRYHSLEVDPASLPAHVVPDAWSEDGVVMGIRFADRPWFGVQFHPESFGTEHGRAILANFLARAGLKPSASGNPAGPAAASAFPETPGETLPDLPCLELPWRDPAAVTGRVFDGTGPAAWLDGPGWDASILAKAGAVHVFHDWNSCAAWLEAQETALRPARAPWKGYRGGPVGQLSYELHRDTLDVPARAPVDEPLARFLLPEGWLAFDAGTRRVFAAWEPGGAMPAWLRALVDAWETLTAPATLPSDAAPLPGFASWHPLLDASAYVERVRTLQDAIARGDSYEACLTHAYAVEAPGADAGAVYRRLRARNPAPYAARIDFGDARMLCASPELFLEADGGGLRGRPIKGTRRRGATPGADAALRADLSGSEKDAAENRMIVDLTRHDFARVCVPGSVTVPAFLQVETHPAVFQLVSEVRGRLAPDATLAKAIASCFPGGSMTGAPKERTVELLTRLEREPRGMYSGALGYLSRGGALRLAMVIRTLEQRGARWRVGCGGAVLADSDPVAEWQEAELKARSVIDAVSA